jgi:competence protein ComEC
MKARPIKISLLIIISLLSLTALGSANSGLLDRIGSYLCMDKSIQLSLCAQYKEEDTAAQAVSASNTDSDASNEKPKTAWQAIMPEPVHTGLRIYFLDVGQGDATLIQTPAGETILIDAGNNDKGDEVVAYLTHLGVEQIDVMIATHPDADHIGGLDTVLEAFEVKSVYAPKVSHTTNTYQDFLTAVQAEKLKIKSAKAGIELKLKDVTATFVAPVGEYNNNLNAWSAVLRLTYGDTSFLLAGDAEGASEKDMLASGLTLTADLLKVGHHGASTSSSQTFLNKVNPTYAVISAAYDNSYGHPTPDVLDRLRDIGATTYRTDLQNTITAVSDGKQIIFTQAK